MTPIQTKTTGEYPICAQGLPGFELEEGEYLIRFARTLEELDAVLKLRYEVFNVELGEGLDESHVTGRDRDQYDSVCHHLMVAEKGSGRIVGTYRMQTLEMATSNTGFYCDDEYDLSALPEEYVANSVELGRACIAEDARNGTVLLALWRGIAAYMTWNSKRFLFGCCSLTSQDPAEGLAARCYLQRKGFTHPEIDIPPRPEFVCYDPSEITLGKRYKVPKLFDLYLRFGCRVCSHAALDRAFKTIDFLVVLDIEQIDTRSRRMFFSSLPTP